MRSSGFGPRSLASGQPQLAGTKPPNQPQTLGRWSAAGRDGPRLIVMKARRLADPTTRPIGSIGPNPSGLHRMWPGLRGFTTSRWLRLRQR
ncbi:hypothetical protein BHE74_00047950 [Ensete ventricosum]|nr:hypothetical protein BHE74_00047950 [Ensete ventricosum]